MILKELTVAVGKYTDRNGAEKTRWATIGHLHETKDGSKQYITLNPLMNLAAIPLKDGDDRVYVNLFDPKPREQKGGGQPERKAAESDMPDDEIPFVRAAGLSDA